MSIFQQTRWQNVHVWKRPALEPFPMHFHGCVEVLYLKDGSAVCSVDFKQYTMEKGDILFIFPDQIHDVVSASEGSENYVLFFPSEVSFFCEVFGESLPENALLKGVGSEKINILFENAAASCNGSDSKYAKGEALGYIFLLLAKLLPLLELKSVKSAEKGFERRVIEYCTAHFSEHVKLSDIATEMGYTPTYFSDIFSEKFKGGFSKFINTLRVEEAKKRLAENVSVAEVAFGCGFGSIRTFNRVFKEHTGKTPREYREEL